MVRSIILAALIGVTGPALAQDSAAVRLLNYSKNVLQEKMFVHIDRDAYVTGETMWLKVYTVDATHHRPVDISKVAYVEIVDKDNNSLVREKIALSEGVGSGMLFVPASIATGNYLVRAYTSWMKNFSADFYFKKPVSIVNSFVKLDPPTVASNKATHEVQFFPEGGTLLAGVPNRIGFKGSAEEFRGALVEDGSNDTIAHFKSLKFGMGSFDFTPASGKKYKAVIRIAGSSAFSVGLPDAAAEGYALRVTDKGDVLSAEAAFLPAMQNGPSVFLLVHTRQQLVKAERKNISQGKAIFEIKKSDLKDGISHITLFDERSRPLAERLFFKAPANVIHMTLQSGQSEYRTRTKVQLDLQTNRAVSQMSVAVYRLDSLAPAQGPTHISDFFYLTSDLRGLVESPQYYFSKDADAQAAADNLMLTQGWRRFNWADLAKKQPAFVYAPEYNGHMLRGITKDLNGNVAPNILTYAAVPGRIIDVYPSRSNSKGEVVFEMKHFIGGQKVLTVADSLYKVELQSPFSTAATTAALPELRLAPSVEKNLLARSVGMQVDKIYNEDHYAKPSVDSAAFYGRADETYYLDDYTRFPVMEEVFREYVPGVNVRKQSGEFKFQIHDLVNKRLMYETPMILLDGVPVFSVDKIMSYDPLKVKKLEVVTRKFYHGLGTFPGIVSFTTYKGDLDGFELDARYVSLDYEGLQLQREFYAPIHDYEKENESRLPDQRSLLYWDANLATDDTGKQSPQFFTSDVQGTYQVVVEGLAKDGASGFATYIFKVKGIK